MNIKAFIQSTRNSVAYNPEAKRLFHQRAGKILKALATKLGYKKGEYDLCHNQGGIAVSGEITLHSDTLYIDFFQTLPDYGFMWRTCKGRKDYTGGPNQWMRWEALNDLDKVAATMKARRD